MTEIITLLIQIIASTIIVGAIVLFAFTRTTIRDPKTGIVYKDEADYRTRLDAMLEEKEGRL